MDTNDNLSPTAAKVWDHLRALSGDDKRVHVTFEDIAETFALPIDAVRAVMNELVAAGLMFENEDVQGFWHPF